MIDESKRYDKGNHYSEFSKDEFIDAYRINTLCGAIKSDAFGLKFNYSSDNSIGRLNEILESADFYDKLIQNKGDHDWSIDIKDLLNKTSKIRTEKKEFSECSNEDQKAIKRLNRLLLEETYPKQTPPSSKYFIPPGLNLSVKDFEYHYKVAKSEPILIIGETGVGKSLFSLIFEKLYREEHEDEKIYPIVKANCAHFGGDPNLVRSELFGHVKGAFTGAISDKIGLVEMANGGALILEEIGDLPLEAQAMLLTFIETGEYYRVGDQRMKTTSNVKNKDTNQQQDSSELFYAGEHRKARVQVVGLTNRGELLREDFEYRFFPFYIPPLHERRKDILYYFYMMFPDIFKTMSRYEVLSLLAYNWPGNVREIERIGRMLERGNEWLKLISFDSETERKSFESKRLFRITAQHMTTPYKTILAFKGGQLYSDLKKNGVDVDFLEQILNKHRVSLAEFSEIPAFPDDIDCFSYDIETAERYGLRFSYHINDFEEAYEGFTIFCDLFFQAANSSNEIFDLSYFLLGDSFNNVEYPENEFDKFKQLVSSIIDYLVKKGELAQKTTENNSISEDVDVFSLKKADLLKLYYQTLLHRANDNQKKAAEFAGLKYTSFRDELKRHGILTGQRKKTNY